MGASPDPTAASTTPAWVPWAVVGAALAAGIGVAAFVSRAPKSHAQIAQEEMRKTQEGYANHPNREIPRSLARKVISAHSGSWSEFISTFGDRNVYTARELYGWLGY